MKTPQSFKDLIYSADNQENYIGHGNPNAKILFLGQEPAHDRDTDKGKSDYHQDQELNLANWKNILEEKSVEGRCNPLHPFPGQKFQVRSGGYDNKPLKGENGTAKTWYNYQKLINLIFERIDSERKKMTRNDDLDFHHLSFSTDMSTEAFPKHDGKRLESRESVKKRMEMFSSEFFMHFPIVIAAVGHFPKEVYSDSYFIETFNVHLAEQPTLDCWVNINIREGENPMLLIHCPQMAAHGMSDSFLNQLANIIVNFVEERNINLLPQE